LDPSAAPDPDTIRKFAAIRLRHRFLLGLAGGLLAGTFVVQLESGPIDVATGMDWLTSVLTLVLLAAMIAVIILVATNWRCPVCRQPLGFTRDVCKECGAKLRE
jgi:hypothetical protein